MRRLFFALIVLAGFLPELARAVPATWITPVGGETWTAGTTHTLAWSGGGPQVFAIAAVEVLPGTELWFVDGSPFITNTGFISWTLPTNMPAGNYYMTIGFQNDDSSPYNSLPFTVSGGPPSCLVGCYLESASMQTSQGGLPPVGACGNTPEEAKAIAEAILISQLGNQCAEGYTLDLGSVVMDVTLVPGGSCVTGFSGPFVAEASGFGCCCADPIANDGQSWGTMKSVFQ